MNGLARMIQTQHQCGFACGGACFAGRAPAGRDTVYKSPTCGCCGKWVAYLRRNGFQVTTEDVADMSKVKAERGVPAEWSSCHTAVVGGYLGEGHVPVSAIRKMLAEQPQVKGITVPSMPPGSPGMEGSRNIPYNVLTLDAQGRTTVYDRH